MNTFLRSSITLFALLFLALGLSFWIATEETCRRFGIEAGNALGAVNLRADLGALFLGMAACCAFGAWRRSRAALVAAATVLGLVIVGRLLGWIASGRATVGATELAAELVAFAVLAAYVKALAPGAEAPRTSRALRYAFGFAVLLLLGSAAAILTPGVQEVVYARAAEHVTMHVETAPLEDDALRIAIAGSSAPLPSASRAKASVVVFAGGKYWVVDTGPESVENLVLWGIPLSKIGGVLLTHFHSDHIGDLGELQLQTWAGGRPERLRVYGGPGVEGVVDGFNRAFALDQGYRTAHHGEGVMPSRAWGMDAVTVELDGPPSPRKDRTALVLEDGKLRITAIEVDHAPIEPAYAYRFDYAGRSVVITGDLKYHTPLATHAEGVDLLVSEAISRSMTHVLEVASHTAGRDRTSAIMHDVQDYHISPEEAAHLANQAHVRHLAFYHLLPAPDGWLMRQIFARGVNAVRDGGWTIADDGTLYTLPLGSDAVVVGRVGG